MKGVFKAVWYTGKRMVYVGKMEKDDVAELVINIEEVTPETMKQLSEALSHFEVDWLKGG